MTPEQHIIYVEKMTKAIDKSVGEAIEKYVNGKIRAMDTKLSDYIVKDEAWKNISDPYIKLAQSVERTWKFFMYVGSGILVIMGIYGATSK